MVQGIASDQLSLDIGPGVIDNQHPDAGVYHLVVRDISLKEKVKQLRVGDFITVVYTNTSGQKELKVFSVYTVPIPAGTVVLTLLGSGAACFLLCLFLTGFHPLRLIVGEDNRYSNSKFQMALWFTLLITSYIAAFWLRAWHAGPMFLGGIDIPQNLLLLSGLSVLTFGAAKGITTSKVTDAVAAGQTNAKAPGTNPRLFFDLTHTDELSSTGGGGVARQGKLDLGDFQMLVVTLLAVVVYLSIVFHFLGAIARVTRVTLPDVDTTILASFGLGQGAYLVKKAVGRLGES